jgi:hypothetical protein
MENCVYDYCRYLVVENFILTTLLIFSVLYILMNIKIIRETSSLINTNILTPIMLTSIFVLLSYIILTWGEEDEIEIPDVLPNYRIANRMNENILNRNIFKPYRFTVGI